MPETGNWPRFLAYFPDSRYIAHSTAKTGHFSFSRPAMHAALNRHRLVMLFLSAVAISGCSSVKLWPFGESKELERPRGPVDATEYRCDGGRAFHLRQIEGGTAVWVMLPERHVRLDRRATGEYSNGISTLRLEAGIANLSDGPGIAYAGCKAGGG